jgi:hypothetical protein
MDLIGLSRKINNYKYGRNHSMIQSKTLGRLLTAVGAALLALSLLAPIGHAAEPAEGYEQFAGCPSPEENPQIGACLRSEITGGHFEMGNKDVPITNPIVLSGGLTQLGQFSFNSKGGLSKAPQQVPGGVIGLTGLDWLVNFLDIDLLQLHAVTELAGTPAVGLTAAFLPIKVHLINPVLGNNCYVGSNSAPINLSLTTGTTSPPPPNEPITGAAPKLGFEGNILKGTDGVYVNNSFAAPGANGCKLVLFGFIPISINGLVNTASGLPAAAGTNETVQEFDVELTESVYVYP